MKNQLEYETTMPKLLLGIRTALRNRAQKLKAHPDFIKIGYLGQSPVFPAFAILPDAAGIVQRYSGNVMLVERKVVIQVYEQDTRNESAMRVLAGYVEDIRKAIRDEGAFKANDGAGRPNAFDWEFGTPTISNTDVVVKGDKVRMSNIPVTFRSKDRREITKEFDVRYVHIQDDEILDRVKNRVIRMPFAQRIPYHLNDEAPATNGLSLSFQLGSAPVDREAHGRDIIDLLINTRCTARIRPDERSLLDCCELAEKVWRTLDRDARFGGCLWNSEVINIDYDEADVRNERRYIATVILAARKPEQARQVLN